jgi:hypothetical protein
MLSQSSSIADRGGVRSAEACAEQPLVVQGLTSFGPFPYLN